MQRLKKIFNISLCLIGFFVLIENIVYAQQIPHFIKYQGDMKKYIESVEEEKEKGKDKDKDKGKDKDLYTLTFRIYKVETSGAALWKETHLAVPIKKKKFEVLLGSFTPLDLRFDEDYWLSVEIENKGEIAPRERMTSVGYAYMSEDSYKLGGRYPDDFAIFGHSHVGEDVVSPVAEAINADTVDGLHADQIGGIRDHGLLEGLTDDDHLQYLNILRGDERYAGAGWDGLTKLKTTQEHIADKNNPHFVTLERLGHIDNNPEEEAPTATERGEPTGTEIQGWADDIAAWGHSNLVANLNADMLDGFHATASSNPLPNALLALGADGKFPASVIPLSLSSGLWTDAGQYIYPNNAGSSFQILDEGHLMIAGSAGIIDATTANPKGTLTVGQSVAGNNIDYSLVIARHGTPPNPGIYSHTAPALLIQDFSGTVPSPGRDKDGLLRINAYRIGEGTPNAFNATLFNVGNDGGEALRVDGLRNTFIGYGQKYPTSDQIGSLFVDGNVGIGTTDPDDLLHILASAEDGDAGDVGAFTVTTPGFEFRLYEDRNTPGWTRFRATAGNGIILNAAAPNTPLGDYPMLAINTSGNVGIGTSTPDAALDVNSDTKKGIRINGDSGYQHLMFANSGSEKWTQYTNGNDLLFLEYNGYHANRVIFKSGGNVGIGTMNPQGALDVNGAIYQRGGLLHADYVFEPGYQLESIEEHADYMWQERHLKAVPKAAKTEEGQEIVEVGARNRGILEELEKAHIYIVQLNERVKQLEAKLVEQKVDSR